MINLLLKEMLERRDKSIYWLSQETGIRYATLYAWAKRTPEHISLETLERVCIALNCQPKDLIVMTKPKRKVTPK